MNIKNALSSILCIAAFGMTIQQVRADDNSSTSREFADANFEGKVTFKKLNPVRNGRFCNIARRVKRPSNLSLVVEGGLQGKEKIFAYGRVNGEEGAGFYNNEASSNGIGFNLVTGPDLAKPSNGRAVNCGISSRVTTVTERSDGRVGLLLSESIGCTERGNGRRSGDFYVCFNRDYQGFGTRTAK